MTISIRGKKINLKDSFNEFAEKKLKKLEKFFNDETQVQITASEEKRGQKIEVTIRSGSTVYRSERLANTLEEAMDYVVDDIVRKIRKNKTRVEKRLRSGWDLVIDEEPVEEAEIKIVKTKRFSIKPMDAEEAVLQMNLVGHKFYMFRNIQTSEVNVVYLRDDGNYGLIESSEES